MHFSHIGMSLNFFHGRCLAFAATHDEPFALPYYFGTGNAFPAMIPKYERCGNGCLSIIPNAITFFLPQQHF